MNKADLIDAIAAATGLTKKDAGAALEAIIDTITSTLKKGGRITLTGFGSFLTAQRQARTGRNPQTGEEISIPARTVPKFKAGKALKDAVE